MLLHNHIAKVYADAELDPPLWRGALIAFGHPSLHPDRTTDGIGHAGELRQETVAGVLHNPAPVFSDLGVDEFSEVRGEPLMRPLLIRAHQARIGGHIGG